MAVWCFCLTIDTGSFWLCWSKQNIKHAYEPSKLPDTKCLSHHQTPLAEHSTCKRKCQTFFLFFPPYARVNWIRSMNQDAHGFLLSQERKNMIMSLAFWLNTTLLALILVPSDRKKALLCLHFETCFRIVPDGPAGNWYKKAEVPLFNHYIVLLQIVNCSSTALDFNLHYHCSLVYYFRQNQIYWKTVQLRLKRKVVSHKLSLS